MKIEVETIFTGLDPGWLTVEYFWWYTDFISLIGLLWGRHKIVHQKASGNKLKEFDTEMQKLLSVEII